MRKVVLSDSDFAMFDHDIGQEDFDFYQRHKDAYRRMWTEQGKRYWIRFIMTFRSFTVNHGIIKDFPGKPEKYDTFVDQAFIYIHEQFVDGKFNSAKKFILDVFILATNRHTIQYMESKSYAKDPFYNKETRDVFRSFFGQANEKSSYIKVYFLMPIYVRLAGSVFNCLRRWLDAVDIGDGEDESLWWTPPNPCKTDSGRRLSEIRENVMADVNNVRIPQPSDEQVENLWKLEEREASSKGPKYVPFWSYGDPRVIDEDNPMYNPGLAKNETDWRKGMDFHKYKNFVLYTHRYLNPANETEADLYHLSDSGIAVFYPQLPGQEERPYDQLQLQAVDSFKDVLQQHADGEWTHGLPRAAHINREHGRQQVVLFDYKLKPNAKKSIKGTVLDSFSINNSLSPECETCGHGTTLTPVVLSPVDSPGKKKNKRNRKKRKNVQNSNDHEEIFDSCGATEMHDSKHVDLSCVACGNKCKGSCNVSQPGRREKHVLVRKPVKGGDGKEVTLQMTTTQKPQHSTLTFQKRDGSSTAKRSGSADGHDIFKNMTTTATYSNIGTGNHGNKSSSVVETDPEKTSYLPDLINSFVVTSKKDEMTKVEYSAETNHLVIRREPKKVESSDDDSSSSTDTGAGHLLVDHAMKHLATKLHQMNYVDKIEKPKTHKVQIIKDDENADKAKINKKDSVNIRFTFNNNAADGNVDALSETKKMFTQEVASIVKTNMGDQPAPSLPRNLENMVKQECRKSHARERLRKKHEMRRQTPAQSSSLLDSLDEGPSPTNEKTVDFPDSSVSKERSSKTGNSKKTEQLMNERLTEHGIMSTKPPTPDVVKVTDTTRPFNPAQSSSTNSQTKDGGKTKGAKSDNSKNKTRGSSPAKPKPTPEGEVPTPERLKFIQDLLREEYKERFAQHRTCNEPEQQTLILGQRGPNVQIVMPTKKTPAQIRSELGPGVRLSNVEATSILTTLFDDHAEKRFDEKEKDNKESSPKIRKLRSCANCGQSEAAPKTFKKCQRCKSEGIRKARYYCGRDCQVEDWGVRHKQEHQEDQLQ